MRQRDKQTTKGKTMKKLIETRVQSVRFTASFNVTKDGEIDNIEIWLLTDICCNDIKEVLSLNVRGQIFEDCYNSLKTVHRPAIRVIA